MTKKSVVHFVVKEYSDDIALSCTRPLKVLEVDDTHVKARVDNLVYHVSLKTGEYHVIGQFCDV